jgi:CSLREA domain-containing protein
MRRLLLATTVALSLSAALAAPAPALAFDTFQVNSTADSSDLSAGDGNCDVDNSTIGEQCTLRAAIQEANALANVGLFADQITFAIGASGNTPTLLPGIQLPTITERVSIDGRTQPGYAGVPLVTVKGTGTTGADFDGFVIGAGGDGSEVNGLVLNNFPQRDQGRLFGHRPGQLHRAAPRRHGRSRQRQRQGNPEQRPLGQHRGHVRHA